MSYTTFGTLGRGNEVDKKLFFFYFWLIYAQYQYSLNNTIPEGTDEGSVPEMRIWSLHLIQSDLKMVYTS